jgi:succinoglycan biosynthesis protein ExoA
MQSVSIIIPCYNEQETIEKLLQSIYKQTYPRENLEVVIADGMSTDGTRGRIARYADAHPDLHIALVDNTKRNIPAALNAALAESQGEIIVRLDAHSMPRPDYIERCVSDIQDGLGENVGGVWEIYPGASTWMAASIAAAAANPIGVGDALYRQARKPARVDTVPFGAFKRELLAVVGFFDETLLTNEDYEFNARIRKSGGTIWLDPKIRSVYFARPTLGSLVKQYARYGFWKWRMLKRYPETLRWRQGLPPLFVLFLLIGGLLAIFFPVLRVFYLAILALYIFVLGITGLSSAWKQNKPFFVLGIPLAIASMHISWGAGFLWSMIKGIFTTRMKQK